MSDLQKDAAIGLDRGIRMAKTFRAIAIVLQERQEGRVTSCQACDHIELLVTDCALQLVADRVERRRGPRRC